jgi:extracellular elastinolytic metalloproteinase
MSTCALFFLLVVVCTTTCASTAALTATTPAGVRALQYLRDHAASLQVSADDLADVAVTNETVSEHTGVTHVYLRQRHEGIEISGADITVNVARDGSILSHAGTFIGNLNAAVNRPRSVITAAQASLRGSKYVNVALTAAERVALPARRVYYPTSPSRLRLAWQVEIETRDGQHWWVVTLDAESGALLHKFNRVASSPEALR